MAKDSARGAGGGVVYGFGLIGAAVYYFQAADTFWEFVLAIPKALIWPGVLVYELLKSVYGG
jgi:hypothetical protein